MAQTHAAMTPPACRKSSRRGFAPPLAMLAALTLAGCETGAPNGAPGATAAAAPQKPMTRQRAAEECWMGTEKAAAETNLDKRADIVTKCINDKMKAAGAAAPKS